MIATWRQSPTGSSPWPAPDPGAGQGATEIQDSNKKEGGEHHGSNRQAGYEQAGRRLGRRPLGRQPPLAQSPLAQLAPPQRLLGLVLVIFPKARRPPRSLGGRWVYTRARRRQEWNS
jgi:hypothetical protein